ncbi:lipase/serine esterase [Histoplasma capsulatum H143]|uniref:Lipase/serine esterase n=1 Tax=Ajellomyces capsulatus (strain H143) TaxID=544712 RepID=C6H592_AJECH|nr:lipase/serine esterase [Histoplasma capsulatum H143]
MSTLSQGLVDIEHVSHNTSTNSLTYIPTGQEKHGSGKIQAVIQEDRIVAVVPCPEDSRLTSYIWLEASDPPPPAGLPDKQKQPEYPYVLKRFEAAGECPASLREFIGSPQSHLYPAKLSASSSTNPADRNNLHIIISTLSGTHQATLFYTTLLKPLLATLHLHEHQDYCTHVTSSADTITHLTQTIFRPRAQRGIAQTIILLAGDGGLVEIIQGLTAVRAADDFVSPVVALVPMGTGNATAHSAGIVSGRDATMGLRGLVSGVAKRLPMFAARTSRGAEPLDGRLWFVHFGPLKSEAVMEVMQLAYDEGRHVVDMRDVVGYEEVEAVRIEFCEGETEERWRRICIDGMILVVQDGQQLSQGNLAGETIGTEIRSGGRDRFLSGQQLQRKKQWAESGERKTVCKGGETAEKRRRRSDCAYLTTTLRPTPSFSNARPDKCTPAQPSSLKRSVRFAKLSMLVTPRLYRLAQIPDNGSRAPFSYHPSFNTLTGWDVEPAEYERAAEMLLVHQVGSVRVGEVVRFTLTYTPFADRILPTPTELFVKVRNTSAIPLRAAYLHGPYTLYTSCYPASFDPNRKYEDHETRGLPQFEPNLKAGGAFDSVIPVPEDVQSSTSAADQQSITWIIEIASQVIFSTTAAVNFEVLVGRDLKSLELGIGNSTSLPVPGHVRELARRNSKSKHKNPPGPMKGVYSTAVKLVIDDTASLWSTPRFPSWSEKEDLRNLEMEQTEIATESQRDSEANSAGEAENRKKRRKVHFVVLTHGLHSNIGADMLYLKESIDAASRKAREDARNERNKAKNSHPSQPAVPTQDVSDTPSVDRQHTASEEDDDDDEHVIVRGFPGNVVRTERGIQYLGKRLAKYVLLMTYPDQPYLPLKESRSKFRAFAGNKDSTGSSGRASHSGSAIYRHEPKKSDYGYQITSISFIGHSLGGLVQTYAIAYIQKHSPEFFDCIKPINFVALASPFLGLSNENPIYKFRNRTVYSNVVNDGIVPLRTSCLLFLDWRGLDRVEKARRESGWVGTMAEWGWAEITGANVNTNSIRSTKRPTNSVPTNSANDDTRTIRRSQTVGNNELAETPWTDGPSRSPCAEPARGDSFHQEDGHHAPPKTTILEAAGDVLKPPLPSTEYILDPSTRARTIFHDRVYHPSDIPPPPPKKNRSFFPTSSTSSLPSPTETAKSIDNQSNNSLIQTTSDSVLGTTSGMKVEEKIARAYHRDLSWRKVLVRLEPDAHNNIIVRRMFANAYGWPVVKHLVDTHFANTTAAKTADEFESGAERAMPTSRSPSESGKEVIGQVDPPGKSSTLTIQQPKPENQHPPESSETMDALRALLSPATPNRILPYAKTDITNSIDPHQPTMSVSRMSSSQSKTSHADSSRWTDRYFDDEDGEGYDSQDEAHFAGSGIPEDCEVYRTAASARGVGNGRIGG